MVSPAVLLVGSSSIKKTIFSSVGLLIPHISSSSLFSSLCKSGPVSQTITPPVPKKVPFTVSAHGITWKDPYHWMQQTDDPDFINYLDQENSYAEAFMADTKHLQQTLFSEMISRKTSKISTAPERWGPWLYYQYIPEGKEYPVLCRKSSIEGKGWMETVVNYVRGNSEKEQVLLDWNEIAEHYGYNHVAMCRVSPDHNYLAYTLDITGGEQFMLQIKNLRSGVIQNMRVDGVVSLAWAQDSRTLFYTISDEKQRPYRVHCSKVGVDHLEDIPIFIENDSSFCVDITSTKDGKFITVNSNSRTSSEVYVIDASNPQGGLQRIHKRVPGVNYFLEHHCGFFYTLTNLPLSEDYRLSGGNYYLTRCRVQDVQSANWENLILPDEDVNIQDMDVFNEYLVLHLNRKGFPEMCSIRLPIDGTDKKEMKIDDLNPWYFPVPLNSCAIAPGSNHDFMSFQYRAVLSSPMIPDVIVDYDMLRHTYCMVHQDEVLGIPTDSGSFTMTCEREDYGIPSTKNEKSDNAVFKEMQQWKNFLDEYCCELKEVVSHDGISIPLTILYSHKAHQNARSPGLLQGYGAYGEVIDKSFCSDRLSLLDRGWVFAFADVRGGGGADPSWHRSGSGLNKSNSIFDFVSCGEYLINKGYVHKCRLGAVGYSAGCLLAGAATNMYPELFRAIILNVPFVDICNTLLDPSLPLTILDYEEFGNPQIESHFQSIFSYSPYDNVPNKYCCPAMLVRASFHDSRVGVWEAAKWVAKVRDNACANCSRAVILRTSMVGGHFIEGGRFGQCEESAYEFAFLMKVMGLSDQERRKI